MSAHLATKLEKYCTRVTDRIDEIIMPDGTTRTLSQVANEMWVRLGSREIDESVLSKVFNGKRLFTPRQIEVFCEVLELSRHELLELLEALSQDYEEQGVSGVRVPNKMYLDMVTHDMESIRAVMLQGNPQLAAILASQAIDKIVDVLQRTSSEKSYRIFLKLLAMAYSLQALALKEYLPREAVVARIDPIIRDLRKVATELNDAAVDALADYHQADALYIRGRIEDYAAALPQFTQAFEALTDEDIKFMSLRGMLRCQSNRRDKHGFEATVSKVKHLIASGKVPLYHGSRLLEGAAGGSMPWGNSTASMLLLEEAVEISRILEASGGKAPFLAIQQIRTHLEIIANSKPTDLTELERVATKGIAMARPVYFRHAKDMEGILEKLL